MRESLPADRERALAAIAGGWGREPTTAHPDCRCGKPKPAHPAYQDDWQAYGEAWRNWHDEHGSSFVSHYQRRDCPVHRPRRGETDG